MQEDQFAERVGSIRPSQILYTYGPGSVIDLPGMSVTLGGLDDWRTDDMPVLAEDRLLAAVRSQMGHHVKELRLPPWKPETRSPFDDWTRIGVPVMPFPRWLRCTSCDQLGSIDGGFFVLKTNPYRPDRARYVHENCQKGRKAPLAVAARFVLACPAGHMDDFPWVSFVHKQHPCDGPLLKLYEISRGSSAGDVMLQCTSCEARRNMVQAFGDNAAQSLPECRGRHPHLRSFDSEPCSAPTRGLLLGASNAWFAMTVSVLSIPRSSEALSQLVERYWGVLVRASSRDVLNYMLEDKPDLASLESVDRNDLWAAIELRRSRGDEVNGQGATDVLEPEWNVFLKPDRAPRGPDFRITITPPPPSFAGRIEGVVLADRLREVVAVTGFTRIGGPVPGPDGAIINRAPLSRKPVAWVPTSEVRGEGIMIRLAETAVSEWEERVAGTDRDDMHHSAHSRWSEARSSTAAIARPPLRYLLLHTLAHVLIRQIALECGYAAASIRERIYAREDGPAMAGILLYTSAPDSEGTLGGLVKLGRAETLDRVLLDALSSARLCSSDPLCAETTPSQHNPTLHAAACHACCFASETSCESGNRYLDRAFLVETMSPTGLAFFD
jgi:hypothetical protein